MEESPRLIRITKVSELLEASPKVARGILQKYGLYPIDFGRGRGRGLRWAYLDVLRVIRTMQDEAARGTTRSRLLHMGDKGNALLGKSADDVLAYLSQGKNQKNDRR